MSKKTLDVICLGRVLVDLYGDQIGGRLEDMKSFSKYVGGSSGNMCIGVARQGLRAAMLGRVGDEHMGRFIREQFVREGVDVSQLLTDPDRLTALVLLGIRDRDTFPLIFFRENCADMAIESSDIDEAFIASAKALAITGTHLSTERTYRACHTAIEYARKNDTRIVLDIDYRPVLWGLTGHGLGEERYIASDDVSAHIQSVIPQFDLIVGTQEEFNIAGGSKELHEALTTVRRLTSATLVVKRGELGVSIFPDEIPDDLDHGIVVPAARVEILNVLGAGDGFMAGFMRGWINDEPLSQCGRYANGCGTLVVSRHGCSPAIPSKQELDNYLARSEAIDRPDLEPEIQRLHRVTTRRGHWPSLFVLAFDHRLQLEEMADELGADHSSIPRLKSLIFKGAKQTARELGIDRPGVIVDSIYGSDVLDAATGSGWWIGRPMEVPKSRPLKLYSDHDIGSELRKWPAEHVVKCLVFYDPEDDADLRQEQEEKVLALYRSCVADERELLLEVIPPTDRAGRPASMVATLERFYEIGVYPDWWKLPSQDADTWSSVCNLVEESDPYCRGIVILGLDAPITDLAKGFRSAMDHSLIKGFAVGRSIFSEPARQWFDGAIDDASVVEAVARNFASVIELWRNRVTPTQEAENTLRASP